MKLKIRELVKEIEYSESRIRALLCRPEFACFVSIQDNEFGHPTTYFDLTETSKKLLLQTKKGYRPAENEDIKKYIDENIKLQKEKAILIDAIKKIDKEIKMAYCNEFFVSLTKKDTDEIIKIIKDVL
jgi:hypothetical protein